MSTTPDRSISGLPRHRPSAAALLKENRPAVPTTGVPADAAALAEAAPEQGTATTPARATRRRPAGSTKRTPAAGRVQIAADVPEEVRNSARAAFRAAAYFEHVSTFSDFVSNALQAEIRRLEEAHNDGQPFEPITDNLPAGRPSGRAARG